MKPSMRTVNTSAKTNIMIAAGSSMSDPKLRVLGSFVTVQPIWLGDKVVVVAVVVGTVWVTHARTVPDVGAYELAEMTTVFSPATAADIIAREKVPVTVDKLFVAKAR
eukprot:GILK01027914.1.p2 GENE.GILK01027914.1~~GILK01027914.1.p2  ORF type:complete len:108 (-),score=7.65 GILK01027914.1:29-352(-)